MFYTQSLSQFTHKAVRISLRVKISWHPHPTYPPLSTLKIGLFPFTRTLREIDPYWIPIFTQDVQELHRNPSNFLKFDSISNHNQWKFKGSPYNLYFFVSNRKIAGGRRPTQRQGGIDRWTKLADRSVWSTCPYMSVFDISCSEIQRNSHKKCHFSSISYQSPGLSNFLGPFWRVFSNIMYSMTFDLLINVLIDLSTYHT
jgi:hypothetical protein